MNILSRKTQNLTDKKRIFQDIQGSASATDVLGAMDVENIQQKHKVYTVGTQLPDIGQRKGLWRLYELVAYAEQKRYTPCLTTSEHEQ